MSPNFIVISLGMGVRLESKWLKVYGHVLNWTVTKWKRTVHEGTVYRAVIHKKTFWRVFVWMPLVFNPLIIFILKIETFYFSKTEKFNGSPNESKSTLINWWLRSSKRWLISVSIEKSFSSKKCDYLQEREFEWFQLKKRDLGNGGRYFEKWIQKN